MSKRKRGECKHCGREMIIYTRGLCHTCHKKLRELGKLNELYPPLINISTALNNFKKCKVEGCERYSYKNGYCEKHYTQYRKYGCIPARTTKNSNEIIINKELNYAEIVLYNNKCEEITRALIDIEDIERVKEYKWGLYGKYVASSEIGNLHRFIMNVHKDEYNHKNLVDHINRNPLDNRKENLRIVVHQENCINQGLRTDNTTGIIGVSWDKIKNKWQAYIRINYKLKKLGYFSDFDYAVKCRLKAELEYLGEEFAPQRHLFEKYEITL